MSTNPALRRLLAILVLALGLSAIPAPAARAEVRGAWSPDGQALALVLTDGRQDRQWISFWDAKTERKRDADIPATTDFRYTSLAYSHNGRLLAAGRRAGRAGLVLQVFDARVGGQQLQVGIPGEASAEVLGFSSDDSLIFLHLASGGVAAVGTLAGEVRTTFGKAALTALSPDGRWLGLGDGKGLRLLDLSGQHDPVTIKEHDVQQLAFGQDGEALAATVPGGVVAWQLPDGHELYRQALRPQPEQMADSGLVYGVDRRSLLVRAGSRLYVLDRDNGSQRLVIEGVEAGATVLLPDPLHRERLLVGGNHRLPLFWNVYFGGHQPFLLENPRLRAAALSADGQWLALGTATSLNEGGFVRLVKPSGADRFDLPGATRSLALAGPELLAADDARGRLILWSLADKQLKARVDGYCAGDSHIVGGSDSAGLLLLRCELADGSVSSELRDASGALKQRWPERAVGLSASGRYVVFSGSRGAELLDLKTTLRHTLGSAEPYRADCASFTPDEQSLVVGDGRTATFYAYEMGLSLPRVALATGLTGHVTAQALTADKQLLVSADNTLLHTPQPVRRWDLKVGNHDPVEYVGGHTGSVLAILPLPHDGGFISVGEDGVARQWDKNGSGYTLLQIN